MAPARHRYTTHVQFTGELANKTNERVLCRFCGKSLTNTKRLVKMHLKKCVQFKDRLGHQINFTSDEEDISEEDSARMKNDKTLKTPKKAIKEKVARKDKHISSGLSSQGYIINRDNEFHEGIPSDKKRKLTITGTVDDPLRSLKKPHQTEKKGELEQKLLTATVSAGLPFDWVGNEEVIELFRYLNPAAVVPSPQVLGGTVLEEIANEDLPTLTGQLSREKCGLTLIFDGWKTALEEKVLGVMLARSNGQVAVWDVLNVHGADLERLEAVDNALLPAIESLLNDLEEKSQFSVTAMTAEWSGLYALACSVIRNKRRNLIVMPSFAQALKITLGDIFRLAPRWERVLAKADAIAAASKSFLESSLVIKQPTDRRWQSQQELVNGILQNAGLLRGREASYAKAQEDTRTATNVADLAALHTLTSDHRFWEDLETIGHILSTVALGFTLLETEGLKLFAIPLILSDIRVTCLHYNETAVKDSLVERIEARWALWEHPLLFLAIVLHPELGWAAIKSDSGLTFPTFVQYCTYYYRTFFGTSPRRLMAELLDYKDGDQPWLENEQREMFRGSMSAHLQHSSLDIAEIGYLREKLVETLRFDVCSFWRMNADYAPELSQLALRVFSATLTSAETEGLFSKTGFPSTVKGPSFSKVLSVARIRSKVASKRVQKRHAKLSRTTGFTGSSGENRDEGALQRLEQEAQNDTCIGGELINEAKAESKRADENREGDRGSSSQGEPGQRKPPVISSTSFDSVHPADHPQSKWSLSRLFNFRQMSANI